MFFRNDDVRGTLDDSLISITNLFIKHNIPITHAVEPANLTPAVLDWLISAKNNNPEIIEIMQHGYDHTIKNDIIKGEFGGQRSYQEQYNDIKAGKLLMDKYFGKLWFECFNFPYAPYNPDAMKAVDDLGFKVFNSHSNIRLSRRLFYLVGHILRKGFFLNHHVSWNLQTYPGTNVFEIDMNFGFIKKYLSEGTDSVLLTLDQLKNATKRYSVYKTVGVLLHHRYHDTDSKIELVDSYLSWVKEEDFEFLSMQNIYNKFSRRK